MTCPRWITPAALLLACAGAAAAPAAQKPARHLVVGYYLATTTPAERYLAPSRLSARKLTHLNHAFANIVDGEIAVGNPTVDVEGPDNFAQLRALKKRNLHLKTLISVGGWEWSGQFSDVALAPESRAKFAASGVRFIRAHGFDGIDIDWEFPVAGGKEGNVRRPKDKDNFTRLLQALRDALDSAGREDHRHYLLTIAAGNNAAYLRNTDMAEVARLLDWVNLMTYDMTGPWSKRSGHVAPLTRDPEMTAPDADPRNNVTDVVHLFLAAGVPAGKIVLGVPFYGYAWKGCAAGQGGQYQPCEGAGRGTWEPGALDYADISAHLVDRDGYERHWNDAAKVPYLFKPATGEFITYDDPRSLREKMRFIKARHLAGAMFWQITADTHDALLDALASELGTLPAKKH